MKKAIICFQVLMISLTGLSQEDLPDTDWILHYMVINGETINITSPPYPYIVFNDAAVGFDVFATVNGLNYFAEFAPPSTFNQDTFIVHEGTVTLGDCEPNCELENQYLNTILFGFEKEFAYQVINESNGNKILTITTPEGHTAVHGNYVLSANEFEKENIKIYPNPTKDLLYIDSKALAIEKINIFSLVGTSVFQTQYLNQDHAIELSFLKNGLYFAEIIFENGNSYLHKFIKE
ncbi:T9SS type A sorting domain-containing protein [Winogradskyella vidalii]|uniref:T9SS type A sorting domain-containing protein n=1 Tax=Winogradskyella vidalii TaxID=2615024 RepID=UPI0015CC0788|nr:T9SS type A sorting domain-containing protein [Winogradskyella vidalii]